MRPVARDRGGLGLGWPLLRGFLFALKALIHLAIFAELVLLAFVIKALV
jgi:hypothetical protein